MSPKLLVPSMTAVLGALPMPVAAVTVPLSPRTDPPAAFTDPAPHTLVVHAPLPGRRLRLDHAPSGDDDLASFAVDGTLAIVPEPRAWALLVVGYGLIGFALRRRGILRRVTG